ncbi:hypothetical protein ACIA8M_15360 [Streptomyces anulatus]|uniref:hypothetical protein n=1 Tax=Streptomyces anulatus TaxID=1892 RepID=UPI0037BDB4B8
MIRLHNRACASACGRRPHRPAASPCFKGGREGRTPGRDAEKLSTPLADAQADLEAAQEAEATRKAERGAVYDREFADNWMLRADEAAHSGDDAHARFFETLSAEPWFAAYVEFCAARHKRRHVLDEAQRAQRALRGVVTVPEQRFYAVAMLNAIESWFIWIRFAKNLSP